MQCSETHDKPKGEVKCCSILSSDDVLFHKSFTKCRYKMIGEECQYIYSNEEVSAIMSPEALIMHYETFTMSNPLIMRLIVPQV